MTNDATVIQFPKDKVIRFNPESDEKKKKKTARFEADTMADSVITNLLMDFQAEFEIADLDFNEEDLSNFDKYFSYSMAVLRAGIYKTFKVDHPMHKTIDAAIQQVAPGKFNVDHNRGSIKVKEKETGNT